MSFEGYICTVPHMLNFQVNFKWMHAWSHEGSKNKLRNIDIIDGPTNRSSELIIQTILKSNP